MPETTASSALPPRIPLSAAGIAIRVIAATAILLGANLSAAIAKSAIAGLAGGADLNGNAAGLAVYAAMTALVCAMVVTAVWCWCRFVEHRSLRSTGWVWTRSSAVWLMLGTAVSATTVLIAVSTLPGAETTNTPSGPSVAFTVTALMLQAYLLQGVPEELLFRGWLLTALRERLVAAVAVTTLSFTVLHLVSNGGQSSPVERLIYLVLPFGFAMLAVGMLLWTRSLWSAAGVHGGFHVGGAIAGAAIPTVDGPPWWLMVGGLQAVVGAVLVVTAMRAGRSITPDR